MNETKRQKLPAGLWIIATPIGNLSDISVRAQQALEEADFILCEDTRRTRKLFEALKIAYEFRKLDRLDAHTSLHQIEKWVDQLREGRSIALVTDAGTPAISDPGARLVARAHLCGVRVVPIPGASAVMALLSVAGFEQTSFAFLGFFPRKDSDRRESLELCKKNKMIQTFLWFESPQRITETLFLIQEVMPDAQLVVGKELTKIFEKIYHGSAQEVHRFVENEIQEEGAVGEWCFGMNLPQAENDDSDHLTELQDQAWFKALRCLSFSQTSVSDAAKWISQEFGIPRKAVYSAALQLFQKKNEIGD